MASISLYKNAYDIDSSEQTTIHEFLEDIRNGKWQDYVLPIRAIKDNEERKKAKTKVPCVAMSGTFRNHRDSAIISHSGYIAIDIDKYEPNEAKEILAPDPYIYSVFTAISGTGVCALFLIDGSKHDEAFKGIQEYLYANYSINIDPAASNVSRYRYISFDPDIYIASERDKKTERFILYSKYKEPKEIQPIIFVNSDFEKIIKQIQDRQLNMCEEYPIWLRCGYALAEHFGEKGRNYFHIISCYSDKYNTDDCDDLYS